MENTHLDPVIPSDANNLPKQEEELKSAEAEVTTEVTPMSREEIITRISELVNGPIEEIKDEVDTLKQNYYKTKRIETEEAYKTYKESGNLSRALLYLMTLTKSASKSCWLHIKSAKPSTCNN